MPSTPAGRAIQALALLVLTPVAHARDAGDPIKLAYTEGDLAGFTTIFGADGRQPIGYVEYVQRRKGDTLEARRVAHFNDGSSDEDSAVAKVDRTLRTIRGQSIIRDPAGQPIVDMRVDVGQGRIWGFYGLGKERTEFDEKGHIPPGTYFGPLVNLVLKNFEANAEGGKLIFHTVAPTPSPRRMDMEISPKEHTKNTTTITRPGGEIAVRQYVMRVTVNPVLNPLVRMVAPDTFFFVTTGSPPATVRFAGPRNYAGQEIRIE